MNPICKSSFHQDNRFKGERYTNTSELAVYANIVKGLSVPGKLNHFKLHKS